MRAVDGTWTRALLVGNDEQYYVITRDLLGQAAGGHIALQWVDRLSAGLAALATGRVDVVLLDLALPDSQGWTAFEKIRDRAPNIPIILLTGLEDERMALKALQAGAQDYLFKGTTDSPLLFRSIRYAVERKKVELSLKHYHEHLEELVADRTTELTWSNTQLQHEIAVRKKTEDELKEALGRLQEHDRRQAEFVSNVSHELKTPLSSLTYAIENLMKGLLGSMPERMRSYLLMMRSDCSRLYGTINDILDMSRIDAKRLVLNLVRVRFDRLARRSVDCLRMQAQEKSLSLTLNVADGIGFVLCDPPRMERVIFNLVSNAIKFTAAGGSVNVNVSLEEGQEGAFILMSVQDTGVGIPPEHLGRIAERFFRINEHIPGSGLGLSLCKELAELHNGRLKVESPPPGHAQGTRVSVWLPVADAPSALAVGANPESMRILETQLTSLGYRVTTCRTGEAARQVLAEHRPDTVIVNSTGQVSDQMEAVGHIRADPRVQHVPIVVITSEDASPAYCEVLRSLQVPSVQKPASADDLLAFLEQIGVDHHGLPP